KVDRKARDATRRERPTDRVGHSILSRAEAGHEHDGGQCLIPRGKLKNRGNRLARDRHRERLSFDFDVWHMSERTGERPPSWREDSIDPIDVSAPVTSFWRANQQRM